MFWRVCCAMLLLASPATAEILVQDGDHYTKLIGTEPIRITGGRIDELIVGGFKTTIEGGSLGTINDLGGTPFLFRTQNYHVDRSFQLGEIPNLTFEGFKFDMEQTSANTWRVLGVFLDYTQGGLGFRTDPEFCHGIPRVCAQPIVNFILHEHLLGDTNGDGIVDLLDLNNVRDNFTHAGGDADIDGDVDLDDLNAVRNNFGATLNPVPEPSTLLLALCAITSLNALRYIRSRKPSRLQIGAA